MKTFQFLCCASLTLQPNQLNFSGRQAITRLCDSKLFVSELPDPLLKGYFPEEEMRIMAHLAKECLKWEPDSRPMMSEIVQILLTISPDKPKRKILPTTYLMHML